MILLDAFLTILLFAVSIVSPQKSGIFTYFDDYSDVPAPSPSYYASKFVEQKVDHIYGRTNKTWQMKFFVNNDFFRSGGPIFLRIGGQHALKKNFVTEGHFRDLARTHKAMLYAIEHRFYGDSHPFDDLSIENLEYLNIEQVLGDIAHFIAKLKSFPKMKDAKVILCGGAYAGSLVVWMKRLYPKVIAGGWASSPPLQAKLALPEISEQVGNIIRHFGSEMCFLKIRNGIIQMKHLFHDNDFVEMKLLFKTCDDFDYKKGFDVSSLYSEIMKTVTAAVLDGHTANMCEHFLSIRDNAEALAKWVLSKSDLFQNNCLNVTYQKQLDDLTNTHELNEKRISFYQKCNELGWFQVAKATGGAHPFTGIVPLFHYITLCHDLFGVGYVSENFIKKKVDDTNQKFGGSNGTADGIFLTYGEYDPWKSVGVNDSLKISIIPKSLPCSDLKSTKFNDSDAMKKIKENLDQHIQNILNM